MEEAKCIKANCEEPKEGWNEYLGVCLSYGNHNNLACVQWRGDLKGMDDIILKTANSID